MGYTTEFTGQIKIEPPLHPKEIEFINSFSDGTFNNPKKEDYPGNYCQWVVTEDGRFVEWDRNEKFYDSVEWMQYLIDKFLGMNPLAKHDFLEGHTLNGQIEAQGEDEKDQWSLIVEDNQISTVYHKYSENNET
jgi:hypothetical protein